jgi:mycothiol S-conjugate amidase
LPLPSPGAPAPLCLLTVHAHPDDEASKGAATVARYSAEGVRTVLVSCTGGEAGEVLNKALDQPEVWANLARLRAAELEASVEAIGYSACHLLGYHDSGMPGTDWNQRPDNFRNAPLDEAVGRLVAIIRLERPQVIVTYPDSPADSGHPDHRRVHEISHLAFDAAGDGSAYPDAGEPWQPLKLYYTRAQSLHRLRALAPIYLARGEEDPIVRWQERRRERGLPLDEAENITSLIEVGPFLPQRRAALLAHRTQIDPESAHWLRLPDDVLRQAYPWEEYELARSLVASNLPEGEMESDLFAGIRSLSGASF